MIGKIDKQTCSKCGKEYNVSLGCVAIYEDKQGTFHCTGVKCECGHTLNSERIEGATKKGAICY